jgi:hypothetical protein
MVPAMLRTLTLVVVVAACSKESGAERSAPVNSPGAAADKSPTPGEMKPAPVDRPGASGPIDPQLRLHAEEGTLAITAPSDAKAGAEAVAKITLTPTANYHVNTDFPIKLVLEPPANVTLEKTELKKADAEALDERQLVFAVKLTAAQSGNYTINGSFKFAVCTEKQCLPKKEPIAIQVATK